MQSILPKDTDPHDIFAIEPDFTPRPNKAAATLAPASTGSPEHREPHFGPGPSAPSSVPPVTPMYHAAGTGDIRLNHAPFEQVQPSTNKWAIRFFWFLFAIVSAMGAAAWQHYGDRAKQVITELVPQVEMLSSLLPGKSAPGPDQTSAPAAQTAAADQPTAQAAPAAPQQQPAAPPQDVAATAAPAPSAAPAPAAPTAAPAAPIAPAVAAPDQTQLLQSMAHDIASMGQQIEQLKASIDQLKASQDQLSQRVVRTTETRAVEPRPVAPRSRAATSSPHAGIAPPSRAAVAPPPVRRPAQAYIPPTTTPVPQTAAPMPPPPPAVVDADDGGPVVRPPMPLR